MLYLGIDGGGTKTKITFINENKIELFSTIGKPSSIDTVLKEETFNNINELVIKGLNYLNINHIDGVFAGLGGISCNQDELMVEKLLRNLNGVDESTKIKVKNDSYIALASSGKLNNVISIIIGTGTICYGIDLDNHEYKCSGWGYKEGEMGSGYHLGFRALQYLVRVLDGRLEPTTFTKEIELMSGIDDKSKIIPFFDENHTNRTRIASLAKTVCDFAYKGDKYASSIINEAVNESYLSIKTVYNKLKFSEPTLVIIGSVGNSKAYFKSLKKEVLKIDKNIHIISPIYDPSLAASILAFNL
jgi:N-acetylglucosamine kinase-like BadF-type ATPase